MTRKPLLRGEKLRLTAIEEADLKAIGEWYKDTEFMRLFDASPARPRREKHLRDEFLPDKLNPNAYYFGMHLLEDDTFIGVIDVSGIEWNHGTGWLGMAIGDPAHRGKGYGTEALSLMLDFAFRELNLHRVQLSVFGDNTPAIALYQKLGFVREAAHRELLHRDGERFDMIIYGILRREWEGRS